MTAQTTPTRPPGQDVDDFEAYKDLVKSTIALPLEGCKSMATGCATIAAIYGGFTAFVNAGRTPSWDHWPQVLAILAPFVLLAIAGGIFGVAYLPKPRLRELMPNRSFPGYDEQITAVFAREAYLRKRIIRGSIVFWIALASALACVAWVRI